MTGSAVFLPELVDLTRRCRMARNALSHGGLLVAVLENNSMSLPAFPAERFSHRMRIHRRLAHSFALTKSSTLLFSIDSALFGQNTPGVEVPRPCATKKYRLRGKKIGW